MNDATEHNPSKVLDRDALVQEAMQNAGVADLPRVYEALRCVESLSPC